MKDKLQNWALAAEIIGGIAVLLSLAFLIIEVRENTEANRRSSLIELTTASLDAYVNNPAIQEIEASIDEIENKQSAVVREFISAFQLSAQDANLYARYTGYLWRTREAEFLYGNPDLSLFRDNMKFYLRSKNDQIYWEFNTGVPYHPEFREFLTEILESIEQ